MSTGGTIDTGASNGDLLQATLTNIHPVSSDWVTTSDSCTGKDLVASIDGPHSSAWSALDLLYSTTNVTPSCS